MSQRMSTGSLMDDGQRAEPQGTGLAGLMAKWTRLEPERVRPDVKNLDSLWIVEMGGIPWAFSGEARAGESAIVLAAVIEAVEARGWDWAVVSSVPFKTSQRDHYVSVEGAYIATSLPPAAALLSAYLAAVEAAT